MAALLAVGKADPCIPNAKRYIPIHVARGEGYESIEELLARGRGGHDWRCDEKALAEAKKRLEEDAVAKEAGLGLSRSMRRRIQEGLAAQGFDSGPADGVFGSRTREAILGWQEARGKAATGYLDEASAKALQAAAKQESGEESRAREETREVKRAIPRCRDAEEKINPGMDRILEVTTDPNASESTVLCAHINSLRLLFYLSHECSQDTSLSSTDRASQRKAASGYKSDISFQKKRYADMTGGAICDDAETAWTNL